ncbi:MAG TPA: hypothetical protein VNM47_12370 [Terriglobia bacterium]|nr:hypothetical protein [Terriglobia bacterium]
MPSKPLGFPDWFISERIKLMMRIFPWIWGKQLRLSCTHSASGRRACREVSELHHPTATLRSGMTTNPQSPSLFADP